MPRWSRSLLRTLLVTLVLLAVLEGIAAWVMHARFDRNFDHRLVVENRIGLSNGMPPDAEGRVWGFPFHTDELGWRKGPRAHRPGHRQWATFGDSVTEGVGVADDSTFSARLAMRDTGWDVVNTAHIGYATLDYVNVLDHLLATDGALHKVTVFFTLNDVYGSFNSDRLPLKEGGRSLHALNTFLKERSALYRLLKLWLLRSSDHFYRYDASFYRPDDPRFEEAMIHLERMAAACRARGIPFDLVMLPYRTQLLRADTDGPQQLVAATCARLGIPFTDLRPVLAAEPDPEGLYLYGDEIHFSDRGHRAVADALRP